MIPLVLRVLVIDSVSLLGGGGASGSEAVLGASPDVLGVLLTAGTGGVSPLGLERPVVSTHLSGAMGTETGSGVSSLLSMEVLLSGHSGESVSLGSASTLGGGSSGLSHSKAKIRHDYLTAKATLAKVTSDQTAFRRVQKFCDSKSLLTIFC